MVVAVVDAQEMVVTNDLYQYETFMETCKTIIKTARENMIVAAYGNTTEDNAYMTGEQRYHYYNDTMCNKRYAICITLEQALMQLRG